MPRLAIHRLTILLVEDDPGDATLVRAYLEEAFADPPDCRHACRLAEAIDMLGREPIDLVLCDLSLPDAQGPETIERLRAAAAGVPVVVLTGRDDPDFSVRLIERGVQDYITKRELGAAPLARAIRHALERHKLLAQLQAAVRREQLRRQILTRIAEDAPLAAVLGELGGALQREIPCRECGFAIVLHEGGRELLASPADGLGEAAAGQLEAKLAGPEGERGPQGISRKADDCTPPIYVQYPDGIRYYLIHSAAGQLLGKFALRLGACRATEDRIGGHVELALELAALATERYRVEESLRRSQAELRQLSGDLLNIQEAERQRISADLHDGIGQSLSMIKLAVEEATRHLTGGAVADTADDLQRLVPRVKDAIMEVRRISMDLRPSTIDDLGILPTLSWFCREFEAAGCRRISIERAIALDEADVPSRLKIVIFRVLQEAVSNIVKHADATQIRIGLEKRNGAIEFSVLDNGRGFDPAAHAEAPRHQQGLGLRSMKERARHSGGRYTLESTPGAGARISISWPATLAA